MAERVKLSETVMKGLELPKEGRRWVYDTEVKRLCVQLTPSARTFYVYRKVKGRPIRVRLGAWGDDLKVDAARKRAETVNGELASGKLPEARGKVEIRTLGALFERYREEHLIEHGKQTKNPDSYWKLYLSKWKNRTLESITRDDVKTLHRRIHAKKSGLTSNRALHLLRAMWNWALAEGYVEHPNPAIGVRKYTERSRRRFLQPAELPRFFEALAESDPDFRDFVLLALLTGARRGNVQAMRWRDVSLERAVWEIPPEDTKTSDTDEAYTIPLVGEALQILERRKEKAREGAEFVFPSHGKTGHIVEPKRAWASLLERAGIEDLRMQDLRRTLGSWQAGTGASLALIGKTLGHRTPQATQVYARLDLDPVRAAVTAATREMFKAGGLRPVTDAQAAKKEPA